AGLLVLEKEVVRAPQCDASQVRLGSIVVDGDLWIREEDTQRLPIFYQVVHGTTCCRARFMTPLLLTSPEQQLREEWATPLRAQREVFRCAHDARFLHVTFHLVQAAEHFERLLEAFVLASLVNLSSRVRHAACSLSLARLGDVVVS